MLTLISATYLARSPWWMVGGPNRTEREPRDCMLTAAAGLGPRIVEEGLPRPGGDTDLRRSRRGSPQRAVSRYRWRSWLEFD